MYLLFYNYMRFLFENKILKAPQVSLYYFSISLNVFVRIMTVSSKELHTCLTLILCFIS